MDSFFKVRVALLSALVCIFTVGSAQAEGEKGTLGNHNAFDFKVTYCRSSDPFQPAMAILIPANTPKGFEKDWCPENGARNIDLQRERENQEEVQNSTTQESDAEELPVVKMIFDLARPYWPLLKRMMQEYEKNKALEAELTPEQLQWLQEQRQVIQEQLRQLQELNQDQQELNQDEQERNQQAQKRRRLEQKRRRVELDRRQR